MGTSGICSRAPVRQQMTFELSITWRQFNQRTICKGKAAEGSAVSGPRSSRQTLRFLGLERQRERELPDCKEKTAWQGLRLSEEAGRRELNEKCPVPLPSCQPLLLVPPIGQTHRWLEGREPLKWSLSISWRRVESGSRRAKGTNPFSAVLDAFIHKCWVAIGSIVLTVCLVKKLRKTEIMVGTVLELQVKDF